jgi:hypothetical protein
MSLAVHRPARSVSSLVADDPVELAADLPRLPCGVTLDPEVLRGAACGEEDLELFYPEPGDVAAEQAAKQLCAACPVRQPCLQMALQTGDQHAILGGTTPAERQGLQASGRQNRWRRQATRQLTHTRPQLAATYRQAHAARNRLLVDASAAVAAHELALEVGIWKAALALGLGNSTQLLEVFTHWQLPEVPRLRQRSGVGDDPYATREAFALVNQVGWYKACRQLHAQQATLRQAFAHWGLGQPTGKPWRQAKAFLRDRTAAEAALGLAVRLGVERAAGQLDTTKRTRTGPGTAGGWGVRATVRRPSSAPMRPGSRPTADALHRPIIRGSGPRGWPRPSGRPSRSGVTERWWA